MKIWATLHTRLWTTPYIFFLAVGVFLLFIVTVVFKLPDSINSQTWPTVKGVVLKSEIHTVYDEDFEEGWCPAVSYRYSVNHHEYVSENVGLTNFCISDFGYFAQKVIDRYPIGSDVNVYYNPENQDYAVLEQGVQNFGLGDFWLIVIITATAAGVGLFFLGLLGILGFFKVKQKI